MWIALLAAAALAQDAVTLDLMGTAQMGHGHPTLTIHSNIDGEVSVDLACGRGGLGGRKQLKPGDSWVIDINNLAQGQHSCRGKLNLSAADGTTGEMPLNFTVAMLPPLTLEVDKSRLDLDARTLTIRASRPLTKLTVEAFGPRGVELGRGEVGANSDRVDIQWTGSPDDEVIEIVVTGWDEHQLPGRLELFPWSYQIPHEDVVFASGKDDITDTEAPKLEAAWGELQKVREKYGDLAQVRLYVAGYTDTVGDAGSNQALSERRAASIARWFRDRGFADPIHYQGFGESVLATPTPDSTDEAANRRAIYLLAADTPALSQEVPKSNWQGL